MQKNLLRNNVMNQHEKKMQNKISALTTFFLLYSCKQIPRYIHTNFEKGFFKNNLFQPIVESFDFCFVHSIFRFWFLVNFGDEVTKILPILRLHFARQDGQNGKKRKEGHATKVTKYQKPKDKNMG